MTFLSRPEAAVMTRIRAATHTVGCIDDYCTHYRSVFHNVRRVEQFTQLELGMLAETKRKSLPRLAKTVQSHHRSRPVFASADQKEGMRAFLAKQQPTFQGR